MSNKMIIDASHPEETRVVVLRGNRVEEFDFESANKKPLRGNIYLAKVTRVEPSLQAAFVDYGGNRHGFLAFSEIHPDYYQIPVADRQALLEEEARAHREEEDEHSGERRSRRRRSREPAPAQARSGADETVSERVYSAEEPASEETVLRESETAVDDGAEVAAGMAPMDSATREEPDSSDSVDERTPVEREPLVDLPPREMPELETEPFPASEASEGGGDLAISRGEDVDGFESVDSDESVEEMTPRYEQGLDPIEDGETADEVGPTVEIERDAARQEAALARGEDPGEIDDESAEESDDETVEVRHIPAHEEHASEAHEDDEDDEDAHDEVTTIGGEGDSDAPVRAPRPRAEDDSEPVEMIGGDAMDETPRRAQRPRRHYKIQEVIKRRQVLLVQVVKEERGNKGAALTTYLSLAGRYSVLMPNTARGGGISRKITNTQDRSRLKAIADELDVPEGMGVILRTAGASRTKPEVKRDFEYLLRMWETVRETTLASSAPTLVYEEGSLVKRAIRDLYSKEIDEIVVAGEEGYREAKTFMRLLMPDNARAVVPYRETQPVFAKSGVEAQLDAMFSNQVTLKSGGYIVINQTEALVAIDVNSGRSTREHNIEDTALRTNLEAADEVARQLRLRDLAGLIVVDFIDMEEGRNNRAVERRMKDALKNDRARIQVGRISHFGLLEMSRQRIRTGVLEGSTIACPHCMGAGVVRSTSSLALHVLRVIEDALIRTAQYDMTVRARTAVALYILNHKRAHLRDLEQRFGVAIVVEADETLAGAVNHSLERGEPARGLRASETEAPQRLGYGAAVPEDDLPLEDAPEADDEPVVGEAEEVEEELAEGAEASGEGVEGEEGDRPRRRRRRRRRGGERPPGDPTIADQPQPADDALGLAAEIGGDFPVATNEESRPGGPRRRRSRRGRRDRFGPRFGEAGANAEGAEEGGAEGGEMGAQTEHEGAPVAESAGEPMTGGYEAAAGMDEAPASIAEALEPPMPTEMPARSSEGRWEPVAPAHRDEPTADAPASASQTVEAATDAENASEPETAAEPAEASPEDPPRPRRTGWWQRAKSTLVGE